uniref:TPR_REGION domain-containing protein n=1 Tax=Angiostrongylus cantonensis TaxID=6313 RepID=A0A158PB47_ANGCA
MSSGYHQVWGEDSADESTWFRKFRSGDFDLEDKQGDGRPNELDDDELKALATQLPSLSTSARNLANEWSSEYIAQSGHQVSVGMSMSLIASACIDMVTAIRSSTTVLRDCVGERREHGATASNSVAELSSELAGRWAQEFTSTEEDLWESLEKEWQAVQPNIAFTQTEEITNSQHDLYVHQVHNPFLSHVDPMAEGDRFMQSGDLGNAMLAYEAAVQRNPNDAKEINILLFSKKDSNKVVDEFNELQAWCHLGLSHAENENDSKAILALNECLKIQPDYQEALLALAVSLTNESAENSALTQLEKWLVAHQGGDPTNVQQTTRAGFSSFVDPDTFKQDPCLWNRLGATLANGNRTPEAVAAYREALKRYPLYVRARYNLGISCLHLNSYREAIEHFVSALELQKGSADTSSIWPTLQSATIRMQDAPDTLFSALGRRDLNAFKAVLMQTRSI